MPLEGPRAALPIERGDPTAIPPERLQRRALFLEIAALGAILLLAAAFRLPALDRAPPYLLNDEAFNGLDIYRIFDGYREPYFPANAGREGLFIYLQALSVLALGPTPVALRLVSGLAGVATVLATWALARAWFGRAVALLSAGGVATLVWHILSNRVGLRFNLAPLAAAVTLGLFWHLLGRGKRSTAALTGIALGLSLQTYLSTRLLPPLLVLLFLAEWLGNHGLLKRRWRSLLGMAAVALLVFSPLGSYYLRHPAEWGRRQDMVVVSEGADRFSPAAVLEKNLPALLGSFNFRGDADWSRNVGERPIFDPVTGLFFLLGLGIAVFRISRPATGPALKKSDGPVALRPYLWLTFSLAFTLLPVALVNDGPQFQRMSIITPMTCILPALGAVELWRWLAARLSRRAGPAGRRLSSPGCAIAAGAGVVLALAAVAFHAYWQVWAVSPATASRLDADQTNIGHLLQTDFAPGQSRLLLRGCPCRPGWVGWDVEIPTINFLLPRGTPERTYDLGSSVYPLLAPPGADQVHLEVADDHLPAPDLPETFFGADVQTQYLATARLPVVGLKVVPSAAMARVLGRMRLEDLDFGDASLVGADLDPSATVPAGRALPVVLRWRVNQGGPKNLGPVVVLRDQAGLVWQTDIQQGIVVGGWREGDQFLSRHLLVPPADAPPGTYSVEAALALRSLDPNSTEIIRPAGQPRSVGHLQVGEPAADALPPPRLGPADGRALSATATLAEVAPLPPTVRPGDDLQITVRWRLRGDLPPITAELLAGEEVLAAETAPALSAGAREVRQTYTLRVPSTLTAQVIRLRLAATPATGDRRQLDLGTLPVTLPERQMAPRPMEVPASIRFGDLVQLAGWDFEATCSGDTRKLRLLLQWQALQSIPRSYTVFIHAVGPDGTILAQVDRLPKAATHPTTAWLPGEYVVDPYELELGGHSPVRIIAGLYDARTGARLPVAEGPSQGPDAGLLANGVPACGG